VVSALLLVASLPQTVTFSHPGAHSSVVLAAFGKAVGETIRPTGSVLRDYFLVRFDEMPVADAKAAIAKALNATWTVSGGVTYLTRTKQQENAEEQELDEAFRKSLEKAILEERKNDAERKPYDAKAMAELLRQMKPDEYPEFDVPEDPTDRLYSRLVASLDVKDLLASPNGRVVYSTKPEGDEKPLPKAWREAYATFLAESASWREIIGSVFDEEDERRMWFYDYGGRLDEVASFDLEIKQREVSLGISFEWEDGGSSMGRGAISYFEEPGSGMEELTKGVQTKARTDEETRHAWSEPDYSFAFDHWEESSREKVDPKSIALPLKRCINDLENNEPLETLVSWPFLQLAEAKGTNMVVLMPDSLAGWPFATKLTGETTLEELFESWWSPLCAKLDANLGCWYLYPFDRPDAREHRTDRAAFGRLLRAVTKRGWRGVAETASFLSTTDATEISSGLVNLLSLAACEKPQAYSSSQTFGQAERMFAALPSSMWRSAFGTGFDLPVEQWPARLREVVATHDFGDEAFSPNFDPETDIDPETYEAAYKNAPKVSDAVRRGFPRGTTLHVEIESAPTLWIQRGDYKQEANVESVGWYVVNGERETEGDYRVRGFAPGWRETLTVEIRIPRVGAYATAAGFAYTPFTEEYKALDKLDPELRKAIEEAVKKTREGDGGPLLHYGGGVRLRLR
jgi:hypothetical protein